LPGLDLPRLMCGSFGTLGILAEATVRVHPIPSGRAWVVRPVSTPRDVQELTYALLASSFAPVAIECDLSTAGGGVSRGGRGRGGAGGGGAGGGGAGGAGGGRRGGRGSGAGSGGGGAS